MSVSTFREEWQSIVDNVLMHATPDQMLNAENCFYAGVIVTLQNLGLSAVEGDPGTSVLGHVRAVQSMGSDERSWLR